MDYSIDGGTHCSQNLLILKPIQILRSLISAFNREEEEKRMTAHHQDIKRPLKLIPPVRTPMCRNCSYGTCSAALAPTGTPVRTIHFKNILRNTQVRHHHKQRTAFPLKNSLWGSMAIITCPLSAEKSCVLQGVYMNGIMTEPASRKLQQQTLEDRHLRSIHNMSGCLLYSLKSQMLFLWCKSEWNASWL